MSRSAGAAATPVELRSPRAPGGHLGTPACFAPTTALYLFPDGYARSCCVNTVALGNVRESRLRDIWRGATRRRIADRIAVDDFSAGCETCGNEIAVEGRAGSYPEQFDPHAPVPGEQHDDAWPTFMGFYLSNACNLQCVQCNGESSSAIRLHRERRPALPKVYGDEFFEDLREFIPHLTHASFVGGEPFLAPETFRVWDLVAELAPGLACSIVTNGTLFNRRIAEALEGLSASLVVSIDSADPRTFESIRVGASFEDVVANLDRFAEYTRRKGTALSINHCLMPQNVGGFVDLLLFAEDRGLRVNVSVVREPASHSLAGLSQRDLAEVHRSLERRAAGVVDRLELNADVLRTELERIRAWASCSDDARPAVMGSAPYTILMFRCDGTGPHDHLEALAELSREAAGGAVHEVRVLPGDVVAECSSSFEEWLGLSPGELSGRPVMAVHDALVSAFGPMLSWVEDPAGENRTDGRGSFRDREVRLAMVAVRDASGRADHVRMLFAELP